MAGARPFLLDVTRLVSRRWEGRQSTGIDRVCYAYLDHFKSRALAVIQHRGVVRILSAADSEFVFETLLARTKLSAKEIATLGVRIIANSVRKIDGNRAFYLNVGHTDFDLAAHEKWIADCNLRPIYLLHDLIPILFPQFCTDHAVKRHHGRAARALQMASGIIVNSKATEGDLRDFAMRENLPVPPIIAAHLARSDLRNLSTRHGAKKDGRARNLVPEQPYFLCVGTIEPRKNHVMLFKLWLRLAQSMGAQAPRLIVVGQGNQHTAAILSFLDNEPKLRGLVTIESQCSEAQLRELMEGASALLLPSHAEGFGLPLIEALGLGVPVIASDLPCLREIGQDVPEFLGPTDIDAWERVIGSFLQGGPERLRQMDMMSHYVPTRWTAHFSAVEEWLETITSGANQADQAVGAAQR